MSTSSAPQAASSMSSSTRSSSNITNSSSPVIASSSTASSAAASTEECPLSMKEWRPFTLTSVKQVLYNVKRFRFELEPGQSLNFPSTAILKMRIQDGDNVIARSQTPITTNDVEGYFDLLIKIYPDGRLTRHLDKLKPGDTVDMRGPSKKIKYPFKFEHIGMVAGGTGLTPMLQSIYEVLRHPGDTTKMSLIFANNSPRDIIMKEELDRLQREHPDQFKVHYVVAKPDDAWSEADGSTGFVTKEILDEHLFPFAADKGTASSLSHLTGTHAAFVCGPKIFLQLMSGLTARDENGRKIQGRLSGYLSDLGFSEENVFKF